MIEEQKILTIDKILNVLKKIFYNFSIKFFFIMIRKLVESKNKGKKERKNLCMKKKIENSKNYQMMKSE